MSNKYYITSNGSFRELHDDELAHAVTNGFGKKKTNHKYIDRKWSKGKWVYTYPDEKKTGGKSISDITKTNTASSKTTVNNTAKKASSEYEAELAYNSKKNVYPGSKTAGTTGTSSGGKSANNTSTTKKASSEYEAELAYNSKKNEYPESATTSTSNNKTTNSKDDKTNDKTSLIEKIKDRLGYDERELLEEYAVAKEKADKEVESTHEWRDDMLGEYGLLSRAGASAESIDRAREGIIAADKYYDEAVTKASIVGFGYSMAERVYLNTPLGKLDAFKEDVASGLEYVADWIRGDKSKKRKK